MESIPGAFPFYNLFIASLTSPSVGSFAVISSKLSLKSHSSSSVIGCSGSSLLKTYLKCSVHLNLIASLPLARLPSLSRITVIFLGSRYTVSLWVHMVSSCVGFLHLLQLHLIVMLFIHFLLSALTFLFVSCFISKCLLRIFSFIFCHFSTRHHIFSLIHGFFFFYSLPRTASCTTTYSMPSPLLGSHAPQRQRFGGPRQTPKCLHLYRYRKMELYPLPWITERALSCPLCKALMGGSFLGFLYLNYFFLNFRTMVPRGDESICKPTHQRTKWWHTQGLCRHF